MSLRLETGRIFRFHLALIVLLGVAHLIVWVAQVRGHPYLRGLNPMFNMNRENNAPAAFSGFALLAAAALLFVTARRQRLRPASDSGATRSWAILGVVFVLLAFDEVMALHENVRGWLPAGLMATGRWHYAWVGPYVAATLLLGTLLFRFWYRLPEPTRTRLAVAGAVFVGGAAGLEVVAGFLGHAYGRTSLVYGIEVWLEESLEMLGVALLIRAVLDFDSAAAAERPDARGAARGMTFQFRTGRDRRQLTYDRRGSAKASRS